MRVKTGLTSLMKNAPVIIVQLIHIEGPMKGEIQELSDPEISIGRHPSCQVQFPKDETSISRMHATIVREGNRFKIVNQGANGTLLNGKWIEEEYLKDGDVLTIAEGGPKVSFLTEIKEEGYIPPPPPQPDKPAQVTPPAPPEPPSPPQPETPAPQVQREPAAPVPQQPVSPIPPVQHQQVQPQPEMPAPQVQREPAAPVPRQPASPTPPVQPRPEAPAPQVQHEPAAPMPRPPASPTPPVQQPQPPPQPKPVEAHDVQILQTKTPLIIQYGPTLRSFNELPVTIGKNTKCDFVLNHPAIIDHQAQFFFNQGEYWIKDLTGRQSVSINGQPINVHAQLNPEDILALSASGPSFRFLGGGRLAEIEEPVQEEPLQEKPMDEPHDKREVSSAMDQADKVIKGAKSMFDKFIKR